MLLAYSEAALDKYYDPEYLATLFVERGCTHTDFSVKIRDRHAIPGPFEYFHNLVSIFLDFFIVEIYLIEISSSILN